LFHLHKHFLFQFIDFTATEILDNIFPNEDLPSEASAEAAQ